jgi:hypothetical protein
MVTGYMQLLLITVGGLFFTCSVACHRSSSPNKEGSKAGVGAQAAAPCNNAYFPVSADEKLEYQSTFTIAIPAYTYVVSFTENSDGSFDRLEESPDSSSIDTPWRCQKDGLVASRYGDLSIPDSRTKLETLKYTGVTIPAQDRWQKGFKWDSSYTVDGQMSFKGAPRPVDVTGVIGIANEIVLEEHITVPAGAYNTFKVVSTFTERLALKDSPKTPPISIKFQVNSWYARDIGLVKRSSEDFRITTVLNSFTH